MLPADLLTKYGLQDGEALEAIEVAIARALTVAIQKNLAVRIGNGLEIIVFPDQREPFELSPSTIKRKLRRYILHQVELELQKRQVMREAEELKELRGKNVPGEISRIADNGTLYPSGTKGGGIIAFAGRTISSTNSRFKYINGPETPLFKKSAPLFGLDGAIKAMKETGEVNVVEGYIDLIQN